MMQIVKELNALHLDMLDADWVQGIFYSEFLEFGDFPSEYEEILYTLDLNETFRNIIKAFNKWLNSEESQEKTWASLSHYVEHQKLLAILGYFIDQGTKNITTKEYRNNALLASRVYYKLLATPGYRAYHIYHSQLFAYSLACLGYPKIMCEHEDSYYNSRELTKEVNSLIKDLRYFVLDLRAIVESLQLNPNDMNFEDILSNLVDITGGAIVNKLNVDKIELTNISCVIYEIIDILICGTNGEPNEAVIRLLFKCILPKLVSASMDSRNANNLVRASYVTYSGLLLTKYGKAALKGYNILLQHLCFTQEGLEKHEVRQARVQLVVGLMSLLPRKSYRNLVKWLLELSTTAKVSHRQIALEMLAKLLSNDPEEEKEQPPARPAENAATQNNESGGEATGEGGSSELSPNDENQPPPVEADDESSQESQESLEQLLNADHDIAEDDIAGLIRQRSHTAPHGKILRAVYERVNDVSGTLRTRALAILTECLNSDRGPLRRAVQELSGAGDVSGMLGVAARAVCDERAAVRRAALALVHRALAAHTDHDPRPHDLGILVGLCRDASILVRSGAISALGELAVQRPVPSVVDAFLSGPMHQLSDAEGKVQEQVTKLIQELLIDRIQKYVEGTYEDCLPWMFLGAVVTHNMRRHLMKACGLLSKSTNCISHRLVDMLSTHLGALNDDRDLQALVLLTSVAKFVDYKELDFALNYYYRIADDTQSEHDPRLIMLSVELIEAWSHFLKPTDRSALREHLVRRIAVAEDYDSRPLVVVLAAKLDPEDLTWADELMHMSEQRALGSNDVGEWLRVSDVSLVAPEPPRPAVLQQYLAALTVPPPEWSRTEWGSAVAGCGRLCVRSRGAAGAAAPVLARLLPDAAAPLPARLNAIYALTDICKRYTNIVEPILEDVCGCLSPKNETALRRAASRVLTTLVLAEYLRLRTPLYFRYCALLADEEAEVREPVEYYVTYSLKPDVIYHHFVDCIVYYNSENAESRLTFDARQLIYDVMVQRLSLVQRLNLMGRLAAEVLAGAADRADDEEDLPQHMADALLDTLTLLCSPRMKLPKKKGDGDAADMEDLQERVTTNIVNHKMKSTVAEVMMPALLRLFSWLNPKGGQVAVYIVRLVSEMLVDFRHEIEELIENDEELVVKVRQFQETIGHEPTFGNTRNLVTTSTNHEPDTPRAPRKRGRRPARSPPRKRSLRI